MRSGKALTSLTEDGMKPIGPAMLRDPVGWHHGRHVNSAAPSGSGASEHVVARRKHLDIIDAEQFFDILSRRSDGKAPAQTGQLLIGKMNGTPSKRFSAAPDGADRIDHPPFAPENVIGDGDELCVWRGSRRTAAQFQRKFHLILIRIEMERRHVSTGSGTRNARIAVNDHRVLLVPIVSKGQQFAHMGFAGRNQTFLRFNNVVEAEEQMIAFTNVTGAHDLGRCVDQRDDAGRAMGFGDFLQAGQWRYNQVWHGVPVMGFVLAGVFQDAQSALESAIAPVSQATASNQTDRAEKPRGRPKYLPASVSENPASIVASKYAAT